MKQRIEHSELLVAIQGRHVIIVGMRRHAMRLRRIQQRNQRGLGFGLRECVQLVQRLVVIEMRGMRTWRFAFFIHRRSVGM